MKWSPVIAPNSCSVCKSLIRCIYVDFNWAAFCGVKLRVLSDSRLSVDVHCDPAIEADELDFLHWLLKKRSFWWRVKATMVATVNRFSPNSVLYVNIKLCLDFRVSTVSSTLLSFPAYHDFLFLDFFAGRSLSELKLFESISLTARTHFPFCFASHTPQGH